MGVRGERERGGENQPSTNRTTKSNHLSMSALQTSLGGAVSFIEKVGGDNGLGHRTLSLVHGAFAVDCVVCVVFFDLLPVDALFRVHAFTGRHFVGVVCVSAIVDMHRGGSGRGKTPEVVLHKLVYQQELR